MPAANEALLTIEAMLILLIASFEIAGMCM